MSFSKLFLLSLFFISFNLCLKLKTKTKCVSLNSDCDLTAYCCADYVCKDYRCSVKGTLDNQVEWAPEGSKCNWTHTCKKDYSCQSHRCVLLESVTSEDEEDNIISKVSNVLHDNE
jgi:hypothetical protein